MNVLLLILAIAQLPAPQWTLQTSGVTARLRGVSAVSDRIAWASGADSTVLRTIDGGATWKKLMVTTDKLDFRDIDAVDTRTTYILSIGNGPASRIYKTTDAGATWILQFKNEDPKAFYDAMSFWDAAHGIVIGDSIDGQFCIMTTENGGRTWVRVPANALPPALESEERLRPAALTSPWSESLMRGLAPAPAPNRECCQRQIAAARGESPIHR
jgi:photosystem II stability/assembly factor-like uncharacterized protein